VIAYWAVVSGDPGPTPGDQTALNVVNDLHASWLDSAAKELTNLGSGWVTWPLAFLAAVALAAWRRWMEFWVLVVGMVMTILLVHGIKAWTDRPRPPDPLVSARGSAFPSGHAAYSTLYVWMAVTVALRLVPGLTKRSLVIAAGILLAALVGLTRVYLRVHWLSDVTAGWALGLSCFSAVAIVVLIVAYIRHNPRRHDRASQLDPGAGAGAGN
jgi:undecaprenyl-diphosphatase